MFSRRMFSRRVIAAVAVPTLVLGLAACAPEPVTGSREKGAELGEEGESGWGATSEQDELKSTELPDDFPKDAFTVPEGAVVDDAGKRGDMWFLVLRAADEAEAESWWSEVIAGSGFVVSDDAETGDGGRSATLTATALTVTALSIPQEDGSVLLSYDIARQIL